MTARNQGTDHGAGRVGGGSACRIGHPAHGPDRATATARPRTGTRRDRSGALLPARRCWCERGDSNPQGLPHWHLKPARLPIPPLSRPPMNAQYAAPEPCLETAARVSRSRRRGHRSTHRGTVDATDAPPSCGRDEHHARLPGPRGQDHGRVAQTAASETPASLRTHSRNAALIGSSAVASGPAR